MCEHYMFRTTSWFKGSAGFFFLSMVSLSASGIVSLQNNPPPPLSLEEPRNYYGYAQASYLYWVAKRAGEEVFISNFYYPPTDNAVQGTVGYIASPAHSGFRAAAGFETIEREIALRVQYTWMPKNTPQTVFSYPNSTAYVASDKTEIVTGGVGQTTSLFQRIDFEMINSMPNHKYLYYRPYLSMVLAWNHEETSITTFLSGNGPFYFTSKQDWWTLGPELGVRYGYFIYKGKNGLLRLNAITGAGQGWSHTNTTIFETFYQTEAVLLSAKDSVAITSTLVELQFGLGYSNENLEERQSYFEFNVNWELQTWINSFSSFNGTMLILQGLTASVGFSF